MKSPACTPAGDAIASVVAVGFTPDDAERSVICVAGAVTVMLTVAADEVAVPSSTVKVKESGPVYPAAGVYTI
jgi:hypothetical protein